jgi:hypothetical protein
MVQMTAGAADRQNELGTVLADLGDRPVPAPTTNGPWPLMRRSWSRITNGGC